MPEETANTTGISVRPTNELIEGWDKTTDVTAALVKDLLTVHRDEIFACWRDSGESKYALSAAISFKGAANAPLVEVKLSWTTKYSDSATQQVSDGTQPEFSLEEEGDTDAAWRKANKAIKPLALGSGKEFAMGASGPVEVLAEVPAGKDLAALPPIEAEIIVDKEDKRTLTVEAATAFVRSEGKASQSLLQRHFRIGYTKASSMLEELQRLDVVGRIDDMNGLPQWVVITETAATEA